MKNIKFKVGDIFTCLRNFDIIKRGEKILITNVITDDYIITNELKHFGINADLSKFGYYVQYKIINSGYPGVFKKNSDLKTTFKFHSVDEIYKEFYPNGLLILSYKRINKGDKIRLHNTKSMLTAIFMFIVNEEVYVSVKERKYAIPLKKLNYERNIYRRVY